MRGILEFADGLLSGGLLVALAVVIAGPVFACLVLGSRGRRADTPTGRRALGLVAASAATLALFQGLSLAVKSLSLLDVAGGVASSDLLGATWFRAGAARGVAAVIVAGTAWRVRAGRGAGHWGLVAGMVGLLVAAGAFLVHAVARLDDRAALMAVTVLHQVAGGAWVGGLVHLWALGRLAAEDVPEDSRWALAVRRFSRLALGALAGIAATAVPLVLVYVGSVDGLVGTAYGSLVATKVGLMAVALALGALNFRAARQDAEGAEGPLRRRVPSLVEAETFVLAIVLFTAATLGAQPPAVDVVAERATAAEVAQVFRPKWPALRTPSLDDKRQASSGDPFAVVGGERTATAYQWSNFSHNVAGLVVAAMALLGLAAGTGRLRVARHWPAGLVVLAIFVFLRASGSDGAWPFGDAPFWLGDAEGFQHRLGAFLALAIGVLEWWARTRPRPGSALPYLFPLLAMVGGVLLLTHSHTAFELKSNYLIQVTHSTMGAFAVLIACGRWLELRLPAPASRTAGALSHVAMLLLALVLVFYREANVVLPID
jgi:putative copper resistance protein D